MHIVSGHYKLKAFSWFLSLRSNMGRCIIVVIGRQGPLLTALKLASTF